MHFKLQDDSALKSLHLAIIIKIILQPPTMKDEPEHNSTCHPPKALNPEHITTQTSSSDLKAPFPSDSSPIYHHISPPSSQQLWLQAEEMIRNDCNDKAVTLLKRCIEVDPNIDDQFIGLGCFQDRVGYHYGSLWQWLVQCKEQQSQKLSPYDLLSLCLSVCQNSLQEKEWYERMRLIHPNNYKLTLGLANIQYNCKKFTEAEELYRQVTLKKPEHPQAYIKIAFIYCLKWNKDEIAAEWAELALQKETDNCYALLIRALCSKDLETRVELLKELIDSKSDYARPYNGLGNAFYNQKMYSHAIRAYQKCIEVSEKYEHPYYGLGSIYNQLGDLDKSIYWYKRCIVVSPGYDYPHYGLGIAYNNKNDSVSAIHWFSQCIRINPQYDCPYYALGNIYRLAKNYPKSIYYYRSSLDLKPIDPLCFVNLALALISQECFEEGLDYLRKAEQHLEEDKMLSSANIEYIKEQLELYLQEVNKHQRRMVGLITLRQCIDMQKSKAAFLSNLESMYEHKQK